MTNSNNVTQDDRLDFGYCCCECAACDARTELETHHIARRHNHPMRHERANLLRLCWECHRKCHEHNWSLATQLALKAKSDPGHYDRTAVLHVQGWAETGVTEVEVIQAALAE